MGKITIIFLFAGTMSIGIFYIRKIIIKKNKQKDLRIIAGDKKREKKLEEYLSNPAYISNGRRRAKRQQIPYEVEYHEDSCNKNGKADIQLIVTHGVVTRKYFMTMDKEVTVGRAKKNDIVLKGESISNYHLVIIEKQDGIYLRDLKSTNGTLLIRGKNQIQVTENAVKLKSEDALILGEYTIKITI